MAHCAAYPESVSVAAMYASTELKPRSYRMADQE